MFLQTITKFAAWDRVTEIFENANTYNYLAAFSLIAYKQTKTKTLAGVAQWIEHRPAKQKVAGLIPSQGTCLGCRPGPQYRAHERQPHIDVSLLLFLPPFPSV